MRTCLDARKRLALALALGASALGFNASSAATTCELSGLPHSFRVVRIDLPNGSEYLGLGIGGRKSTLLVHENESDWHLSHGIVIINAQTREIGAYWIHTVSAVGGGAPPRAVLEVNGQTLVNQRTPVSEGVNGYQAAAVPPGLPAGTWYAVGFGVGGGQDVLGPTEWRATVISPGIASCEPLNVAGESFEYNHTHFSGGTQLYASGIGIARDVKLTYSTARAFVVGLMSATAIGQAIRDAELLYTFPAGSGRVHNDLVPLASRAGSHQFRANYQGYSPNVVVAGVAFDP